jgi:hypothetical protein
MLLEYGIIILICGVNTLNDKRNMVGDLLTGEILDALNSVAYCAKCVLESELEDNQGLEGLWKERMNQALSDLHKARASAEGERNSQGGS